MAISRVIDSYFLTVLYIHRPKPGFQPYTTTHATYVTQYALNARLYAKNATYARSGQ